MTTTYPCCTHCRGEHNRDRGHPDPCGIPQCSGNVKEER